VSGRALHDAYMSKGEILETRFFEHMMRLGRVPES
jgi:hypothetical protein